MTIYLYVKQCVHCNLKYFGKHTGVNPIEYVGSGTYWQNHLRKHLSHLCLKNRQITLELFSFEDQPAATDFALDFSFKNDIVGSDEWANLVPENALSGVVAGVSRLGKPMPEETKRKISESLTNKHPTDAMLKDYESRRSKPSPRTAKVIIDSIEFESHIAAAKHYGVTQNTITKWKKTGVSGNSNYWTHKKRICVYDVIYESKAEAARQLKIDSYQLERLLNTSQAKIIE